MLSDKNMLWDTTERIWLKEAPEIKHNHYIMEAHKNMLCLPAGTWMCAPCLNINAWCIRNILKILKVKITYDGAKLFFLSSKSSYTFCSLFIILSDYTFQVSAPKKDERDENEASFCASKVEDEAAMCFMELKKA